MVIMSKFLMCLITIFFSFKSIEAQEKKALYTLFFVDKSASSENNSNARAEFKSKIHSIVSTRYGTFNSEIRGFTLQQGTLSTSAFIDFTFKFKPKSCENCGLMKRKMIEQQNQQQILARQNEVQKIIVGQFNAPNSTSSSKYTDLWGSLELISRFFEDKKGDMLVVYSSDMVESMPGKGRRDFHKNPLKDRADAIKLAKEDMIWIKSKLKVNLSTFKGLKIEVWPPKNTMQGSKHPNTIYYWETLFGAMGAKFEWKN